MKTASSFFPTNTHTKLNHSHHDRTYTVIRKPQDPNDSYRTLDSQVTQSNIFRQLDQYQKKYSVEHPNPRPIGGLELFRKMDQNRDRNNDYRKNSKRTNTEGSQRNINTTTTGNRFKRQRLETQGSIATEHAAVKQIRKSQPCEVKQQTFKSNYSYIPEGSSFKVRTKPNLQDTAHQSAFMRRPKSESKCTVKRLVKTRTEMQQQWADEQFKAYHDKMAMINQIHYHRPLVQLYGDKYFECTLRNCYEQDSKPPAYLYLIKDKFTDSKVISKLRSTYLPIHDINLDCKNVRKWGYEGQLQTMNNDSFSYVDMSINESQTKDGMNKAVTDEFSNNKSPHNHTHDYAVDIQLQTCPT